MISFSRWRSLDTSNSPKLYPTFWYTLSASLPSSAGQPVPANPPGQSMTKDQFYQTNWNWTMQYPGEIFTQGPANCKMAAFTLDDGPDNLFLPVILDILAQYQVKATFFLQGTCVHANPDMVKQLVNEGHMVANHTYNHLDLTTLPPDEIREEIASTETEIQQLTGLRTALFRPPYGALNDTVVQIALSMGYRIILWNVDSFDWMGLPGPQIVARVIPNTVSGSIILMHNACGGSVAAGTGTTQSLPYVIEVLRAEGYSLATITALLNIPAYQ